jgi:hypothetical protein
MVNPEFWACMHRQAQADAAALESPPVPPAGDLRDGGMPADVLRALEGESARKVRRDGQHGEWLTIAPDGLGLAWALPAEMCEPPQGEPE